MREVLCSKIHHAVITEADLSYEGSITIDEDLLDLVGLWRGQKVLVASLTTGARLETYIMTGARGTGMVCMNGAAAHLIKKGEVVIVMGFELRSEPGDPARCILVDPSNRFVRYIEGSAAE